MWSALKLVGGGRSRRSWRLLCGATVLCGVGLLGACSNVANDRHGVGDDRPAVDVALTPLRDEELRDIRGGLKIAGLDLDFAAQVQVFANNVKVAMTQLALNSLGGIDSTTAFPNQPPAGLSVSPFMQDGPVGLNSMQGFTITAASGLRSFVLHAVDLKRTATAVINSINGISVKQVVDTTLTINNFAAVQSKLLNQAAARLAATAGAPDAIMSFGN